MTDQFWRTDKIKVALITGHHSFDVPELYDMFRSFRKMVVYPQHLEHFASSDRKVRNHYDVLAFYNFQQKTPDGREEWYEAGLKKSIEQLGRSGKGILILHHAAVAFRKWEHWSNIVGIRHRMSNYELGETINIKVHDSAHPITRGLKDWKIKEEIYRMDEPSKSSHVLLETDHPRSVKALCWTRKFRNSKVVCMLCGHGKGTYSNKNFHTVIERSIFWLAGKI
jgi:type 1 glutamine amidotransferase